MWWSMLEREGHRVCEVSDRLMLNLVFEWSQRSPIRTDSRSHIQAKLDLLVACDAILHELRSNSYLAHMHTNFRTHPRRTRTLHYYINHICFDAFLAQHVSPTINRLPAELHLFIISYLTPQTTGSLALDVLTSAPLSFFLACTSQHPHTTFIARSTSPVLLGMISHATSRVCTTTANLAVEPALLYWQA